MDLDSKTPLLQEQKAKKPPVSRPKHKRRRSSFDASTYNSTGSTGQSMTSIADHCKSEHTDPGLTLIQILTLTLCMAGVQFTCKCHHRVASYTYPFSFRDRRTLVSENNRQRMASRENSRSFYCSYGTPYLLSLNLSKKLTALVWLAGPLSGLLVQPVTRLLAQKDTMLIDVSRFIVDWGFQRQVYFSVRKTTTLYCRRRFFDLCFHGGYRLRQGTWCSLCPMVSG